MIGRARKIVFALFILIVIVVLMVLFLPATHTRIYTWRFWDDEDSKRFLIVVENGEYGFLRDEYGLDIFDNDTVNKYFKIANMRRSLIELLFEEKMSEHRTLNYTALALSGTATINISILDAILIKIIVDIKEYHLNRMYLRDSTLINTTGVPTVNPNEDLYLEMSCYIVFIEITYSYDVEYFAPICGRQITYLRELFVFSPTGEILVVSAYNTTLVAK